MKNVETMSVVKTVTPVHLRALSLLLKVSLVTSREMAKLTLVSTLMVATLS